MTTGPESVRAPGRLSVKRTARSRAPVDAVWPLIGEARRWKEWTFLDRTELLEEGDPAPDGTGALRRFTRFGVGSSERVLAWDPPRHLAYTVVKGFPVRNYRADVTCTPDGPGTLVSWSATFDPLVPGTGPLMAFVLGRLLGGFATGAARHAELGRPG
ncbi:MAG: SRPBCC family protein [Acidimicrobiales bacterium]